MYEISIYFTEAAKQLKTATRSHPNKEDVQAYLIGRLPLTWSVITHLLQQLSPYFPETFSITDYGSGPGTALLALDYLFDQERFSYTGLEAKKPMLEAAMALKEGLNLKAEFIHHEIHKETRYPSNLAIASYLLNELPNRKGFFSTLLAQHELILVIEPGTPDGYRRILELREEALVNDWHIISPCPHALSCPLLKADWCHFYLRVPRPKLLKDIKGGVMGYEDEKYSYLFLSKTKQEKNQAVIIKKPVVYPFKVTLEVCAPSGHVETIDILKKDKERYKQAKKADWGDFI